MLTVDILDGQNSLSMWLQSRTEVSWKNCTWGTKTGNRIGLKGSGRALCNPRPEELSNFARMCQGCLWWSCGSWGSWLAAIALFSPSPVPVSSLCHLLVVLVLCGWCCSLLPHQLGFYTCCSSRLGYKNLFQSEICRRTTYTQMDVLTRL